MAYRLDSPNIVEIYGKKYYNSPKPCKNGHVGLHFISGMCVECSKTRGALEHRKNYKKSTREILYKSPEYQLKRAEEDAEYKKKWYQNNKKRINTISSIKQMKLRKEKPYFHLIKTAKGRAFKRGIEFSLTKEWAEARWTGKCELSAVEFQYFENNPKGYFYSPSLDRIDNNKGYIPDNCRFILYALNIMKGMADDSDVVAICNAMAEANKL